MTVMDNEDPALPDDLTVLDAHDVLSDDATLLHGKNPEDEVADNMLKAEEPMREMADLLAAVLGNFTRDDDLPDNPLPGIYAVHRQNMKPPPIGRTAATAAGWLRGSMPIRRP